MSIDGPQRQRHGVSKNLVEGIGGALVGAALVLLIRGLLKPRTAGPAAAPIDPSPSETKPAPVTPDAPSSEPKT